MAYLKTLALFAASILILAGCSDRKTDKGGEKPVLMVSIAPQQYILSQLAGDSYDIVTMLERGADPETFDPSIERRMAAEKAQAYFGTGVFPFEESIRGSLHDEKSFVNTSEGIDFIYGTHDHSHGDEDGDHHEEEPDPHVWTSVTNAKIMASNMAKALADIMPDSASAYNSRLERLNQRLDSIDSEMRSMLAKGDSVFAIWHPSLSYLARDYGLEQIAVGFESKEMGAKKVRNTIDNARDKGVHVFFFQKEYDTRQAESINEGIGSELITIEPLSADWEGQMKLIGNALSRP